MRSFVLFHDRTGAWCAARRGFATSYVIRRGGAKRGSKLGTHDPKTNKVVHVIKGFVSPEVARFSPDGNRIYIPSRSDENVLTVMDRKSEKIIKKVPLSGWAKNLSNSPTLSRAATNAGVILGTAAYMSPEWRGALR